MSLVRSLAGGVFAAVLAAAFAPQVAAQVGCVPNPNLTPLTNNPKGYVNGCPIPAAAFNNPAPISLQIASPPAISVTPTGNPITTLTSLSVQSTTSAAMTRQYQMNLGLVSNSGVGGGAGVGDRATFYPSIEVGANSGNAWAINPLVQIDNTAPLQAHHQISELDINNNQKNVDATLGPNGMQYPNPSNTPTGGGGSGNLYVYGELIECSGTFNCTAGLSVDGANKWLRGIGAGSTAAVTQATFFDYGNATTTLDVWGTHTNVIDMTNTTTPSANYIKSPVFNVSGSGVISMAQAGVDNPLVIGQWGTSTHYNAISLSGTPTASGTIGIAGGATGDPGLYLSAGSGGNVTTKINGVSVASMSGTVFGMANGEAFQLYATTVASLPTCNSGSKYWMLAVSDLGAAQSYNGAVTGGGGTATPVFCDGSAWKQR